PPGSQSPGGRWSTATSVGVLANLRQAGLASRCSEADRAQAAAPERAVRVRVLDYAVREPIGALVVNVAILVHELAAVRLTRLACEVVDSTDPLVEPLA